MERHVLMIAEAVTLAHVGRMLTLAGALHRRGVAVELGLGGATGSWATPYPQHRLPGIGAGAFGAALRQGTPVLRQQVLEQMVQADLALLSATRPALVIGDFRLSLSVSARLSRVPYATLTNPYWSPGCTLPLEMPVLPLSRWLPLPLARTLFDAGKPWALPLHSWPMNRCRVAHGLPSLGRDLRRAYTDADHVLFADPPDLFPGTYDPQRHHFLGPVLWAPAVDLPPWWDRLEADRPLVYVSMGSSGDPAVLRALVSALAELPVQVVASTAGHALEDLQRPNLHLARYLPGDQVAARAALVVCNGGSMGCQQAFVAGVPVLGVAGNMDQFLNMRAVEAAGAGLLMRSDRVRHEAVRLAARRLLEEPSFRQSATALGERMRSFDAGERLFALLPQLSAAPT